MSSKKSPHSACLTSLIAPLRSEWHSSESCSVVRQSNNCTKSNEKRNRRRTDDSFFLFQFSHPNGQAQTQPLDERTPANFRDFARKTSLRPTHDPHFQLRATCDGASTSRPARLSPHWRGSCPQSAPGSPSLTQCPRAIGKSGCDLAGQAAPWQTTRTPSTSPSPSAHSSPPCRKPRWSPNFDLPSPRHSLQPNSFGSSG